MSMFADREGNLDPMTIAVFGIATLAAIAIIGLLGGAWVAMFKRADHVFDAQGVGVASGAILAGLAAFATAYAVYWRQDGRNALAIAQAQAVKP